MLSDEFSYVDEFSNNHSLYKKWYNETLPAALEIFLNKRDINVLVSYLDMLTGLMIAEHHFSYIEHYFDLENGWIPRKEPKHVKAKAKEWPCYQCRYEEVFQNCKAD